LKPDASDARLANFTHARVVMQETANLNLEHKFSEKRLLSHRFWGCFVIVLMVGIGGGFAAHAMGHRLHAA